MAEKLPPQNLGEVGEHTLLQENNWQDGDDENPLHEAIIDGDDAAVLARLTVDNANTPNRIWQRPLHLAAIYGRELVARMLLALDVDASALTVGMMNATQLAQANGHDNIARLIENYQAHKPRGVGGVELDEMAPLLENERAR